MPAVLSPAEMMHEADELDRKAFALERDAVRLRRQAATLRFAAHYATKVREPTLKD